MIYLKFPSSKKEMVQYAIIEKPRFSKALETALCEMYSDSLASKYSKKLGEFIYEKMKFPEDGIYCVNPKAKSFFIYSKQDNTWINTHLSPEDYIINSSDPIWPQFFNENSFMKKAEWLIKRTIQIETEKLFSTNTWEKLSSIELSTGETFKMSEEKNITSLLENFFSKKRILEIYSQIRRTLFSTLDNNFVLLFEKGSSKAMLNENSVTLFSESNIQRLQEMFADELESSDLKKFMIQIKNRLFYGKSNSLYEICYKDQNGHVYAKYNGLTVRIFKNHLYIKTSDELLNYIEKEAKSYPNSEDTIELEDVKFNEKYRNGIFITELNISIWIGVHINKADCNSYISLISLSSRNSEEYYLIDRLDHISTKYCSTDRPTWIQIVD